MREIDTSAAERELDRIRAEQAAAGRPPGGKAGAKKNGATPAGTPAGTAAPIAEDEFAPLPVSLDITRAETPPATLLETLAGSPVVCRGEKLLLAGVSKAGKTWIFLNLAIALASGHEVIGLRAPKRLKVLYLNFELIPYYFGERVRSILSHKYPGANVDSLYVWHGRGQDCDLEKILARISGWVDAHNIVPDVIIIDPIYKALRGRVENAAEDVASLLSEIEHMAKKTGSAVFVAHHFAKGDQSQKSALDRFSGSGVWARDPDVLVTMTDHRETDCSILEIRCRHHKPVPPAVLMWEHPAFAVKDDLDPTEIGTPQTRQASANDEKVYQCLATDGECSERHIAEETGIAKNTVNRCCRRLQDEGRIIGFKSGQTNMWRLADA